jgi:hypothetical protein
VNNPLTPRYLSAHLHDSADTPRAILNLRKEDPKFDAIMAELVVIKRLLRRHTALEHFDSDSKERESNGI